MGHLNCKRLIFECERKNRSNLWAASLGLWVWKKIFGRKHLIVKERKGIDKTIVWKINIDYIKFVWRKAYLLSLVFWANCTAWAKSDSAD